MAKLTGQQLKDYFKRDAWEVSAMLSYAMKDFYPSVTAELVKKEIEAQLAGAEPCNLNYGLWIQTYLRDGID